MFLEVVVPYKNNCYLCYFCLYLFSIAGSAFPADEQEMPVVGSGGSEDVSVSAVGQFQSAAQVIGSHGEVAHGDVRACEALQSLPQVFFVHCGDGQDAEPAAGKSPPHIPLWGDVIILLFTRLF